MSVASDSPMKIISMARCLHGFGPNDLKQILAISTKATWAKGVNVFMEGDKGRDMYIICSGQVFVWRGHGRTRVKLAELTAGDSLGEMGLVSDGRRMAGAQAVEDTVALRISYEGLQKVPSTAILLFRNIAAALSERLTTANDVIFQSKLEALSKPREETGEETASE